MARRLALVLVLASGMLLLLVSAALAHPGFRPPEVAGGEPTELTLAMAHGCTEGEPPPDDDEQVYPTTLVAVQVPAGVRDVEPSEKPGWTLEVERDGDGAVTAFEWRIEDGTEAVEAPAFQLTATAYGSADETIHWAVYQECTEGFYRWIDTGGDPDADPAVRLTLTSGATPPPTAPASPSPSPTPSPGATPSPTITPSPSVAPSPPPVSPAAPEPEGAADDASLTLYVILALAAAALVAAGVWWRRRP